ncbi:Conserved_hypothetical protein [Hexamita inflata]|uniref:Uncharacterized protein n=1 Tax=Hexamita inflata TaxID=28002 RepID=A0AA86NJE3_9EUKA|nr:Conserved hypothetical protein [Hexamita inflata]
MILSLVHINFAITCNSYLTINNQTLQYCQKQNVLNNVIQSSQIIQRSKITSCQSVYTEFIRNFVINNTFYSLSVPSFTLFGLIKTKIEIQSSKLSVSLNQTTFEGALICFQCNLNANQAEFIYVSFGKALSGLILRGLNYLDLNQVLVQIRLSGDILGGLYSQTLKSEMSLKETNVSGYFNGTRCGALIAFVSEIITVKVQNTRVCTNDVPNIFQGSDLARISEVIQEDCTVCGDRYYAYGLCLQSLNNGVIQLHSLICSNSFVFDNQNCVCSEGQIQNGSNCVDILNTMSKIVGNNNILGFQVGTKPNPDILSVGQRFQNNITALNNSVSKDINTINNNLNSINQSIDAQQPISNNIQTQMGQLNNKVQDFVSRINCNRQYGYSWQNGQCALLSCSVEGQAAINGVCQCPGIYQYVQDNKCVCPENSAVVAGACSCTITGQILQNQVCVCFTKNAIVVNGACTCGVYGLNSSNTCSCPANSNVVVDTCTCNVIYGQSMIDGSCQCSPPQTMVDGKCKFVVNSADIDYICSQQLYVTQFDILEITNTINGVTDFSSGYVFSTTNVITNAFINIVDGVYASSSQLSPLFQSQSTFTNIKIQICSQTIINGAFMTPASIIEINQVYIFSKLETSFSVATYLYLIQATYTSASNHNINNLAINLNITAILGNFALINSISGLLTIQNYSVKGRYNSQGTLTFLGITIQSSTVVVTNVSVAPTNYIVGNSSSYLFSSTNGCTLSFSQISVIIGSTLGNQVITIITTTSSNFQQFGGYVSYLVNTNVQAINLIYQAFLHFGTQYLKYSGLLLGWSNSNTNKMVIENLCFYSSVSDNDACNFYSFGLVGQNNGNISMQQAQIELSFIVKYANAIGIIASQAKLQVFSEIINVLANVTCQFDSRGEIGAIFGQQNGLNIVIQNCTVKGSTIQAKCYVGGVVGSLYNQLQILNITVINLNVTATDNSTGAFIGWSSDCSIMVNNSSIQYVRITTPDEMGIILGRNFGGTTFTISKSWSVGIYANGVLKPNCASLVIVDSYGC